MFLNSELILEVLCVLIQLTSLCHRAKINYLKGIIEPHCLSDIFLHFKKLDDTFYLVTAPHTNNNNHFYFTKT